MEGTKCMHMHLGGVVNDERLLRTGGGCVR
jgi:hypothetical protein